MESKLIRHINSSTIELAVGIVAIAMGAFMLVYLSTVGWAVNSSTQIIKSPTFFPRIIAFGMVAIGVIIIASNLGKWLAERRAIAAARADGQTLETPRTTLNAWAFIMIAVWVLFAIAMPYIGFIIAGAIFLLGALLVSGERPRLTVYLVSLALPIFFYLTLGVLLKVRFPTLFL